MRLIAWIQFRDLGTGAAEVLNSQGVRNLAVVTIGTEYTFETVPGIVGEVPPGPEVVGLVALGITNRTRSRPKRWSRKPRCQTNGSSRFPRASFRLS